MKSILKLALVAAIVALYVPIASASGESAVFGCTSGEVSGNGIALCGGSIHLQSGSGSSALYSGSTLLEATTFVGFPEEVGEEFTFNFDMTAGTASLTDAASFDDSGAADVTLNGTIIGTPTVIPGNINTQITLEVAWSGTAEGTPFAGLDFSTITFVVGNNSFEQAHVSIFPTPEPASLLLLGTGLLGLGGAVRRRWMN